MKAVNMSPNTYKFANTFILRRLHAKPRARSLTLVVQAMSTRSAATTHSRYSGRPYQAGGEELRIKVETPNWAANVISGSSSITVRLLDG
jgi:hypothetical protein